MTDMWFPLPLNSQINQIMQQIATRIMPASKIAKHFRRVRREMLWHDPGL
jgi:hypothetical protein